MKKLANLFKSPLKILLFLIVLWIIFANLYFGIHLEYTAIALFLITAIAIAAASSSKNSTS